tara:strand:+ start:441 stop:914 length:474 start_codon:yes stop_codon:yes gene_type:complete
MSLNLTKTLREDLESIPIDQEISAGFVVVRYFNGVPKVLCLRVYSKYDLPKGRVENRESILGTAIRETYEESGIVIDPDTDMSFGLSSVKVISSSGKIVYLFLAVTDQDPEIRKSPSGRYEHHGYKWMDFLDAAESIHKYLRPAIVWAHNQVQRNGS